MKRTLRYLPTNLFQSPALDIFAGQARLALTPDLDALQQCARRVVARLPHSEHSIKVDMGIDKGRGDKHTSTINLTNGAIRGELIGDTGVIYILNCNIYKVQA